jgi:hypothetical protein
VHVSGPLALAARQHRLLAQLTAWRQILFDSQLIGQDSHRYGGYGYGNVSVRVGRDDTPGKRAFIVSATQTSGLRDVGAAHFCLVSAYDVARNRVWSSGHSRPSSESMTHGAIYDLSPRVRCVLHAHAPQIWRHGSALKLPSTDAAVPYGTPQMAREVRRLHAGGAFAQRGIFVMGGHEDGVVTFGRSVERAGSLMLTFLARAFARDG